LVPEQDDVACMAALQLGPLVTVRKLKYPTSSRGESARMVLENCRRPVVGSVVDDVQDGIATPNVRDGVETLNRIVGVVPVQNDDADRADSSGRRNT
jgi:hypothetical protein